MNDLIGKNNVNKSSLPQKITVKKTDIFWPEKSRDWTQPIFANISPKLAKQSKNTFESYSDKIYVIM